jgi:hypothetical protein
MMDVLGCPDATTEMTDMDGAFPLGTVTVHNDLGTTGGVNTLAPAGTVSAPSFTGTAWSAPGITWPVGVPTASGTAVSAHTGTAVADHASHTHTSASSQATPDLFTSNTAASGVSMVTGGPSATLTHSVTQPAAHSVTQPTIAWPSGVPSIGAYTPAGTVSAPTFTGTLFDNRPVFRRVIYCRVD